MAVDHGHTDYVHVLAVAAVQQHGCEWTLQEACMNDEWQDGVSHTKCLWAVAATSSCNCKVIVVAQDLYLYEALIKHAPGNYFRAFGNA